MTARTFTTRDRRTLRAGATIVVAILAVGRAGPAWLRWSREARTAAAETATALRQARNTERAGLTAPVARRHAHTLAATIVPGHNAAEAATSLAAIVSDAAEGAGVRLGALQLRSDTADFDGGIRVAVRGDLDGDLGGIAHFVAALESGRVVLAVRELELTAPSSGAPTDRPATLRAAFTVEALAMINTSDTSDTSDTSTPLHARTRHGRTPTARPAFTVSDLQAYDGDVLTTAADSIASRAPFLAPRLVTDPTSIPPAGPALRGPLVKSIPQLTLGGIMGGPPWRAVITGFPGRDGGVIVAAGDTIGVLRVQAVRRNAVVIAGADTTWTLTAR